MLGCIKVKLSFSLLMGMVSISLYYDYYGLLAGQGGDSTSHVSTDPERKFYFSRFLVLRGVTQQVKAEHQRPSGYVTAPTNPEVEMGAHFNGFCHRTAKIVAESRVYLGSHG